jgi:hypothetical protein
VRGGTTVNSPFSLWEVDRDGRRRVLVKRYDVPGLAQGDAEKLINEHEGEYWLLLLDADGVPYTDAPWGRSS